MNQRNSQRNKDKPGNSKDNKKRNSNRRRRRPNRNRSQKNGEKQAVEEAPIKHIPKRYGVIFYDTLVQAKESGPELLDKAKEVDQLNIVIRAEAPMDDPDLLQYGKLYAGEAWSLIHERRLSSR